MTNIDKLYDIYVTSQPRRKAIDFMTILSPYAQQLSIIITEDEIVLEKNKTPLNTIPQRNIFAIVDEEKEIYIILRASIYIINKDTGEIKINIRKL